MKRFVSALSLLLAIGCSVLALEVPELRGTTQLITLPNPQGHSEFREAIRNAKTSLQMTMYRLKDYGVIDELVAAGQRGVAVQVLIDEEGFFDRQFAKTREKLKAAGASVRGSSSAFSLTHAKAMVVDSKVAFITSINLTLSYRGNRDIGVIVQDPAVIADMNRLFEADWKNALKDGSETPDLNQSALVVSPTNAEQKLIEFLDEAKTNVALMSENMGHPEIQKALIRAVRRGLPVQLIVPMCDLNQDPVRNYPFTTELVASGVQVRVMPAPSTPQAPYMHAKMILVDDVRIFVGSVNFSFNSIERARELGIVFSDAKLGREIRALFNQDWSAAFPHPSQPPTTCASF